jgi:hypothetical protein
MTSIRINIALVDVSTVESVTFITYVTCTEERTVSIRTESISMTTISVNGTLINVGTVESVTFVPDVTLALKRPRIIGACGVLVTRFIYHAFVDISTVKSIALISGATSAKIRSHRISTEAINVASISVNITLIDVGAVESITFVTDVTCTKE